MDADILANYASHLKALGFRSWMLYEYAARRFLRWLSARNRALSEVDPVLLHEYLLHRRAPGHRPSTLKAVTDRLRVFFRYAVREKLAAADPTRGVSHLWLDVPGGFPAYQGVLRRLFRGPHDIMRFRLPLFAPHWESYLASLLERGYAKKSLYHVLSHNAHFHRHLAATGVRALNQVTPRLLEDFLTCKRRRFRRTHARPMTPRYFRQISAWITDFLAYARRNQPVLPPRPSRSKGNVLLPDDILDAYLAFCRDHRGLSPATRRGYREELLRLRSFLGRRGVRDLRRLRPADLDAFLMRRTRTMGPRSMQSVATALRSFLRYLHLDSRIPRDLAASVVSPSRFRADLRPKYLPWRRIEELLEGVDRSSPTGKRDYAILVLLACHGLRAREAAGLTVSDVDFGRNCLRLLRRKNGTAADVPISRRAAEALRDHLAARCKGAPHDGLFLTARAPIKPLSSLALVCVAQRHLRRMFGRLQHGSGGAYTLRHSFAKTLLDRGATLADIGALLGHKSQRSTLIYTRIATEDMREVADNYAQWL